MSNSTTGQARIPTTIDAAVEQLAGIDRLVTAKEWERAAIVWAFVQPMSNGGDRRSISVRSDTEKLTCKRFADLGIRGLRHHDTVRIYWANWQYAIDQGHAQPVAPGDTFVTPDLIWPRRTSAAEFVDELMAKSIDQKVGLVRFLLSEPGVEDEFYRVEDDEYYRETESDDRAAIVDIRHAAHNRRIADPQRDAESSESVGYSRERDGHKFLDALAHIADATIKLGAVANDLVGLELTAAQKDQIMARFDRLATNVDLLRTSITTGSIDDELAEILKSDE